MSTLLKVSQHGTRKIMGQHQPKRKACMEQWYCTCMLNLINFSILSQMFLFFMFPYPSFVNYFCHITFYKCCSLSVFVRDFPFSGFHLKFEISGRTYFLNQTKSWLISNCNETTITVKTGAILRTHQLFIK